MALLLGIAVAPAAAQAPDFARDVRPILADRCFRCHGPDAQARKALLRLDQRGPALAPRGDAGGPAVVPGDPAASELIRRVSAADPDERMPPPHAKLPALTVAEVEVLRAWIKAGAPWGTHWAFRSVPRSIPVPPGSQGEIDAFIAAELNAAGLAPAPAVSRERLIRRLSFDLTGLPPSLAEIDAFTADRTPGAVERLVDRLLGSRRFGERMASLWLDAARYADTLGYQADRMQRVWPWRDWVVRAFNDNLPYDDFLTWQLAGDLVPAPTLDSRLATAFNRLHRQTEEGGTVEEEFRVEYIADRVETFGTAMLGLTVGCARCHDHKFDPISQREFYRLFAFFGDIDESGQTSHFTDAVPVPALQMPGPATEQQLARLDAQLAAKQRQLDAARRDGGQRFSHWLDSAPQPTPDHGLIAHFPLDDAGSEGKLANLVDAKRPGRTADAPTRVAARLGHGFALDGENALHFPGHGDFSRADPFSVGLWLQMPSSTDRAVIAHKTKAALDAASRGWQLLIEDGALTACLAHMWPHNSIKVASREALPVGRWVHVALAYDGSSRAAGLTLYIDGERAATNTVRDNLTRDIRYERGGQPDLSLGQRFRDRGLKDGRVDDLRLYDRALSPLEFAEIVRPGALTKAMTSALSSRGATVGEAYATTHGALRAVFHATADPVVAALQEQLTALRREQCAVVERVPEIMTMAASVHARPTHLLRRGAYDAPGERVDPGTPAVLTAFGAHPRNRLGLAQWLVAPDHPLTARVAVNRFWQLLFGRGLVETAEDFGSQGTPPSHAALLDWLARRFVDSGWDVKALLALMATSSTYRQSSAVTAVGRERDPDNRLLARAQSYRWPAEMLRDAALHASGLLVEQLGGPPVKPYQPPGLWQEKSGNRYVPSQGDGLYRRSLYTFFKRTSPPPAMILLDAPRRVACAVRRQRTATPLQALLLLNDTQFVEAARGLAERAHRTAKPDATARIRFVFRVLTSRQPNDDELAVLRALLDDQLAEFAAHPSNAEALLGVGQAPRDTTLPTAEVAALTILASAVFSYDETVTRR